jgi:hypothetical protein
MPLMDSFRRNLVQGDLRGVWLQNRPALVLVLVFLTNQHTLPGRSDPEDLV